MLLLLLPMLAVIQFSRVHARGTHSNLTMYIDVAPEMAHARRWLNRHLDNEQPLLFDFISNGWGIYLHAHTARPDVLRNSVSYGHLDPSHLEFDWSAVPDVPATRKTVQFHLRIKEYRPTHFILAGEKMILPEDSQFYNKSKRWSYIRPYLTSPNGGKTFLFRSPYVEMSPVKLTKIFHNSHVEVYRADYEDVSSTTKPSHSDFQEADEDGNDP